MRCPNCKRPADGSAQNPYRPFCSERCQMVDLGGWVGESYRVTGGAANDREHPDDRPRKKSDAD